MPVIVIENSSTMVIILHLWIEFGPTTLKLNSLHLESSGKTGADALTLLLLVLPSIGGRFRRTKVREATHELATCFWGINFQMNTFHAHIWY